MDEIQVPVTAAEPEPTIEDEAAEAAQPMMGERTRLALAAMGGRCCSASWGMRCCAPPRGASMQGYGWPPWWGW